MLSSFRGHQRPTEEMLSYYVECLKACSKVRTESATKPTVLLHIIRYST
jgi:hypothetical protein